MNHNHYQYHGQTQIIFIRSDDISDQIASKIRITGDEKIPEAAGAVFKMNANYAGYTNGAIWEWLTKNDN